MSGEEKGDAKQEQTADDRRDDGAANMPLSQAARIARLKAAEEQNCAAQQTAARHAAAIDSIPGPASELRAKAAQAVGHHGGREPDQDSHNRFVVSDEGRDREPQEPTPQASREARLQGAGLARQRGHRTPEGHHAGAMARRVVEPDHRSGPGTTRPKPLPAPDRPRPRQAADRANPKAQAAVERLKDLLDAKNQTRDEARGEAADETAEPAADRATNAADPKPVRDGKGLFVKGNPGGPGRPPGSKDSFPRNSYRAMLEIIVGRIEKALENEKGEEVNKTAAEVMADALFDGMAGQLVLRSDKHGTTIANPLHAVKLYHDFMWKAKELKLRKAELKKNQTGTGGGIRIVLPSVPADPLLRPGQTPRPLRLLGQDPDKPLPDTTGTTTKAPATKAPASAGPVPAQSPAPNSDDKFDPAELIEDFEHPICECCTGLGWVRDENGIEMVKCGACEGVGRAAGLLTVYWPAPGVERYGVENGDES